MPLHPTWADIALRLALTMIAGTVIGFNRGVRGHGAGLRTTILVGLAAAVAMIQANILLPLDGKTSGSFAVMDLMRLPLGILTGVGFIGGGTILKRGDLVTGVTTAATLWAVTVIGLCLGGGQLGLGVVATVLAVLTLWALRWLDVRIPRDHRAVLVIESAAGAVASVSALSDLIAPLGFSAQFRRQNQNDNTSIVQLWFEICWRRSETAGPPTDFLALITEHYPVLSFELESEVHH